MINTSDRPLIKRRDELNIAVRMATGKVFQHLEAHYGKAPNPPTWGSTQHAFQYFFVDPDRLDTITFDEEFVQVVFDFVMLSSRNYGVSKSLSILDRFRIGRAVPGHALVAFRRGLRLLLLQLREDDALLLPVRFSVVSKVVSELTGSLCNGELIKFLQAYRETPNRPHNASPLRKDDARRLFSYGPRIIWATDWNCVEDVSIYEYAELHRALLSSVSSSVSNEEHVSTISVPQMPWTLLLAELSLCYPTRVQYKKEDIGVYAEWMVSKRYRELSLTEFVEKRKDIEKEKEQQRREKGKQYAEKAYSREQQDRQLGKTSCTLHDLSKARTHTAIVEYFGACATRLRGGLDWLKQVPAYPGREHIQLAEISSKWRNVFAAYLRFRSNVKGYETSRGIASVLNLFGDYVFLYLLWWKEIYPENKVSVPLTPRQFTRYAFVYRTTDEPIEVMPRTLLELIKLRRVSIDSQYAAIKQLALFFRFVESHYGDDEQIAGKDFRSPIYEEFDLPRVRRRTKTAKVIIPKGIYGYLLFYGYAVEAFGEYLLQQVLADKLSMSRTELRNHQTFQTDELGFVPLVRHRGKLYPVFEVPNIFVWTERIVKVPHGDERCLYIPHLTILRLLLAAVETGLRLQGLQWLDIRIFDSLNKASNNEAIFSYEPREDYIYRLLVNTDKTRDEPWTTEIVYRARCLLLREAEFQRMIVGSGINEEVPYEGRVSSRFAPIAPLFRSTSKKTPVSDHKYQQYWAEFLAAFERFYAGVVPGQKASFVTLGPIVGSDGKGKVAEINERPYCPLSLRAIHTPHSCRATYATNRQGILETSDIAVQLGHLDEVVTTYYQKPRVEDLQARLEEADKVILVDFGVFDRNDATYIRADKPDSALVKGFTKDRKDTIRHFGFMPSITLWSSEDTKNDDPQGIDLLRTGPMSHLKFRETHICPVGEECPSDVVVKIGAPRRCGLCPLAMKCVDHLPAISAKKNELIERIRYLDTKRRRLEQSSEPPAVIDEIWEEMDLDTNEFLGWKLSEETLLEIYNKMSPDGQGASVFHAERPDTVRRHLQVAMKQTPEIEFLLKRIAESNAYPSMETPQIQAIAAQVRRRILAGNAERYSEYIADAADEVTKAAKLLKTVMMTKGVTIKQVVKQIQETSAPGHHVTILRLEQK